MKFGVKSSSLLLLPSQSSRRIGARTRKPAYACWRAIALIASSLIIATTTIKLHKEASHIFDEHLQIETYFRVPVPEFSLQKHFVPLDLPGLEPDAIPPNYKEQQFTDSTPPSLWFDAVDTYGRRGYVADPTLLQKSVRKWHANHNTTHPTYWDRLQKYQSHLLKDTNRLDDSIRALYMEETCKHKPDDWLKILTERIKVDKTPTLRLGKNDCLEVEEEEEDNGTKTATRNGNKLKLFCGVYTHDENRDLARIGALSYGWKCDGFLAFSTATIPSLGMVALLHRGEEMYDNMFQKTRSILSYVAEHYLDDYDYFHLTGDDTHLIVENFRSLMLEYEKEGYSDTKQGRIFGQIIQSPNSQTEYFWGGPGYTLDRIALRKLHEFMPNCYPNKESHAEDGYITKCVKQLDLEWGDNRDKCTGQQRSHGDSPKGIYNAVTPEERNWSGDGFPFWAYLGHQLPYWAGKEHPTRKGEIVGLQLGLDAASNHSVAFHRLSDHVWMARHHALVYRACDLTTPLGKLTDLPVDGSIIDGGA